MVVAWCQWTGKHNQSYWTSKVWKKVMCRNTVITKILTGEGADVLYVKSKIILSITQ